MDEPSPQSSGVGDERHRSAGAGCTVIGLRFGRFAEYFIPLNGAEG